MGDEEDGEDDGLLVVEVDGLADGLEDGLFVGEDDGAAVEQLS